MKIKNFIKNERKKRSDKDVYPENKSENK